VAEVIIKIKSQLTGDGLDKAKKGLEDVQKESDNTSQKSTGMETVLTGAFHRIGAAAVEMAAVAVQAVGSMVADSVTAAMNFEQKMSGVGAVLGANGGQMRDLTNLALDLGSSTAFSADQAADGIEMLAKNGLTAEQILSGAAQASLDLAAATGGDLADSADIMTDAMAIFGKDVGDLPDVINGISGVTVKSKFDLQNYALALAQGGGVAMAAGVSFEDFNTAISVMSPLFASGSDAGTSFKTMLTRLVPASGPAADAMMAIGLLAEDGTNKFYDANGELKDMASISQILQDALGGLSDAERTAAISTIFGADAMRAAVALADGGADAFENMAEGISETSAADQAAVRLDNFAGAMEALNGAVDTLKILIGTELLPILGTIVNDYMIPFVQAVVDAIQAFRDGLDPVTAFANALIDAGWWNLGLGVLKVRDAIVSMGGWLVENQGPLIAAVSTFTSVIASGLVPTLVSKLIPALVATATASWAAVAPWLPLIAAAAVLAAIAWVIADVWGEQLAAAFTAAGGGLAGIGAAIVLLGQLIWDWLVTVTGPFFSAIGEWATKMWSWVTESWEGMSTALGTWWNNFTAWLGRLPSIITFHVGQWAKAFTGWIGGLWEGTKTKLGEWWDSLKDWVLGLPEKIKTEAGKIGTAMIEGINSGITTAAQGLWTAAGDAVQGAMDWVKEKFLIRSPSKVWRDEIGAMMGIGMAEGLMGTMGQVRGAAAVVSQSALAGATAGVTNYYNYNYAPTYGGAPNIGADAALVQSMAGAR
jgi:TP901 family phage tail tape measure protein